MDYNDHSESQEDSQVEHTDFVRLKQDRKRAEEDAQLLANRIALLKQEEAKTLKKIEDTRKRAQDIMDTRLKNLAAQRLKEEQRRQKEEAARQKAELKRRQIDADRQQRNDH